MDYYEDLLDSHVTIFQLEGNVMFFMDSSYEIH